MSDDTANKSIAIVGMAGRFPGARDVGAFWRNLCAGVECISHLTDEQMRASGFTTESALRDPHLVRRMGVLDGVEEFDAAFFDYSAREAAVMDPQQRFFLECAWEALEHAGYDPRRFGGMGPTVGVYAGLGFNRYLLHHLRTVPHALERLGELELLIGGDKDFLATRVAYKLDLRGPAVTVQTACSTSLAAVVMACQSLLSYGCDAALAGGVTINVPSRAGYVYHAGGTLSPDGHCRPFDARAGGLVPGNGVGIVVLKRASDAINDGDTIYALIRGAAMNNDGSAKVGYTAPSVEGQAQVIAAAQVLAGVTPDTISYVEAHGTGTQLGDPIEVAGLTQAFGPGLARGSVAIGSVKASIGHLDTAAGVAGLIKATLALHHREIPASLNFETANPKLELDRTPFFVNSVRRPWQRNGHPRRAGVSSFGIGGTNAHVVLEEAPEQPAAPSTRSSHVLVLSARTPAALASARRRLAEHLEANPQQHLADVEWTLQTGRSPMSHRAAFVCDNDPRSAAAMLLNDTPTAQGSTEGAVGSVVFLFPGQGAQHVQMGRQLYKQEPVFRRAFDRCSELLQPELQQDLRQLLWPDPASEPRATELLDQTAYTQPALFAFEYALAQVWMSWGIRPAAMAGHSIGEYVAACLAGVFSLEDALRVVAARGRLMQQMPAGAMLSVQLPAAEAATGLDPELCVAVVNEADGCVIAGPPDRVDALQERLAAKKIACRRVRTSHAFHSAMMQDVLAPFEAVLSKVSLRPPAVPVVSNVTGTWLTHEQATDPTYWSRHLRQTVQFHGCLSTLMASPRRLLLEVGPGTTLTSLATRHERHADGHVAIPSCRHPKQTTDDVVVMLQAVAQLWVRGTAVEWKTLGGGGGHRRRVALPTYPFERERHWLGDLMGSSKSDAPPVEHRPPSRATDVADFFYLPSWREKNVAIDLEPLTSAPRRWLICARTPSVPAAVVERLRDLGQSVTVVSSLVGDEGAALAAVQSAVADAGGPPSVLLDLCDLEPHASDVFPQAVAATTRVLQLAKAASGWRRHDRLMLIEVTSSLQSVFDERPSGPGRAAASAAASVASREVPGLVCRSVDLHNPKGGVLFDSASIDCLIAEALIEVDEPVVAYRGRRRFVREVEQIRLPATNASDQLVERGCYLITGGLGGIGLALAEALAQRCRARLVLLGRTALAPREAWETEAVKADPQSQSRIAAVRRIEEWGGEVLTIAADAADPDAVRCAVQTAVTHFGRLDGVIHAAGIAPGGALMFRREADVAKVLAPKVAGAAALRDALAGLAHQPRFVAYCSSLASVIGVPGQVDYSAANAVLDAMAHAAQDGARTPRVLSINWDTWSDVGMASTVAIDRRVSSEHDDAIELGLKTAEGVEAFFRTLNSPWSQVLVSTRALSPRLKAVPLESRSSVDERAGGDAAKPVSAKQDLSTTRERVAAIWREFLGVGEARPGDDFFQLGGHSLLAVQIAHRLEEVLAVPVTPDVLFNAPTLGELTTLMEEMLGAKPERPMASPEVSENETERLLALIETMSDGEVQALLKQELAGQ